MGLFNSNKSNPNQTATRHTLSEDWKQLMNKIDWMAAPGMANYVNGLVSKKDLSSEGHWAQYALNKYILPIHKKKSNESKKKLFNKKVKLSMLSLACGSAHIDESLIKEFNWPITDFMGLEYDAELIKAGKEKFNKLSNVKSEFQFFDFNNPPSINKKYDIVFCCHSIHHATDLEKFLPSMNSYLSDDGIIIGIDFFGPTRFQIEYETQKYLYEIYDLLPDHFKRDLRTEKMQVTKEFDFDSIKAVRDADISESVRSSDLRTLLFSNFPVVEILPMGGTILRWLMQYRAGNYLHDNSDHVLISKLLQIIERELIFSNKIKSDDLFFVLKKSTRF